MNMTIITNASRHNVRDAQASRAVTNYLNSEQRSLRFCIDLPAGCGTVTEDGALIVDPGKASIKVWPVYMDDGQAAEVVFALVRDHGLNITFAIQRDYDDATAEPFTTCADCSNVHNFPNCPQCCPPLSAREKLGAAAPTNQSAGGHPHHDPYPGGYHGGG